MAGTVNTKRIAKNTLMLYFRQALILVVSLYTVRVVLNTLGVEDYGIYSVVGGIVTFFSFLSGSMASATQRFFSYALGENNQDKLNKSFCVNLIIYILIALLAIFLLETVGLWFVNNKLKVPLERFSAAVTVFQFAVIAFIFTIVSSPFMAIIIAHEDMQIYAYVSIIESILKLGTVFILKLIPGDKLILYSILLAIVGFVVAALYIAICVFKYQECQFKKFYWDKKLLKETASFTGWTLFGQLTSVGRTQLVTILINQFFNPIVVSARTIATQVANHINVFSNNFNIGLYPSIVKTYAAEERDTMFNLVFKGCKIAFFLIWIFALPLFIEMEYVLTLWLKNPPEFSILFTRLGLIEVLILSIGLPLATAARATGKMKSYELSLGSVQILIFLSDLILFTVFKTPAYVVFIVAAVGNAIMFFLRLIFLKRMINFSFNKFFLKVLLPIFFVMLLSTVLYVGVDSFLPNNFIFVCLSIVVSVIINVVCMWFIGLSKEERKSILEKLKNRLRIKK